MMNKERRTRLSKIVSELEGLLVELDEIKSAEEEAYDSMPESFQNGEKGDAAQEAISAMDDAYGEIESAKDALDGLANS